MLFRKKILIVDDEVYICQMVKRMLENTGKYKVSLETDGNRVVAAARSFRPNLILLDIVMPGIEGHEISIRLLDDKKCRAIPVVFMTGIITDDEVQKGKGTMFGRPCIAKPITKEKLLQCVEANLR